MKVLITLSLFCILKDVTSENSFYFQTIQDSIAELNKFSSENISDLQKLEKRHAFQTLNDMSSSLDFENYVDYLADAIGITDSLNANKEVVIGNCSLDMSRIIQAVQNQEMWAYEMVDSIGKPESDIMGGTLTWTGSYDECKGVKPTIYLGPNRTQPFTPFEPKFCMVVLYPLPPLSLPQLGIPNFYANTGFCLPDSCSEAEALGILNTYLLKLPKVGTRRFLAASVKCTEEPEIDDVAIAAMVILGFLTFLSLLGTSLDISYILFPSEESPEISQIGTVGAASGTHDEKSPLLGKDKNHQSSPTNPGIIRRLLLSFSLYSNGKKLLNTAHSAESLTALNGVRFLSISWVVLGHTYAFIFNSIRNGNIVFTEMVNRWTFQAIANALVSVDSFFALSGLLLSYLTLKEMERKGGPKRFNWLMFYFHRFWRLTPVYMLIMLADIGLFRYVADGPGWPAKGVEADQCKESWWWNLLYINNFEIKKNVAGCFGHAWYLANDMQFFILSPLMLIPLFYNGVVGIVICMTFIVGTWIATGVISTHYDLPPTSLVDQKRSADYMKYYYVKPWCRMGPYVVGIMAGYMLYKFKGRIRINKFLNIFIWAVMTALALVILYGLHDYINTKSMETEIASLFNTTHRTLWGVCVCWVIFACATGNGGFVNTLLSWGAFAPLARLSYCVYLVHPFIMYAYYYSRRQLIYLTDHEGIYFFLGHLVLSNMVAFVASLLFEAPMLGLEKIILKRGQDKKKS